mmetsp:Transcript_3273/g.20395  ORF Transcript_3273/g.20395 Transcript_3273/m.20395 type:complete len:523 (-) Transcript_3273:860-2428(-)
MGRSSVQLCGLVAFDCETGRTMLRSEHRSVRMRSQGSHPSLLQWVRFAEQIVDWIDGLHLVLSAVATRTCPTPTILRMDPQPSPKKRSVASFLSICAWWSLLILSGLRSAKCENGDLSSPWNANASACEASWTAKWKKHQLYMQALEQLERAQAKELSKWNGKRAYDMYEPEWVCESEMRVGPEEVNVGDGPKFVCGVETLREEQDCLVYSIGSGFRFQFEEGVRKHAPNCVFHVFDGTMDLNQRALPSGLEAKRIHFHNWNLQAQSGRDAKGYPSRSLEDVLRELDHVGKTIHIFKIDCEGCEYTVLPRLARMVQDGAVTVGQIQVEVHGTDARKIQALFQSLRGAGFMIFHKERNHWGCQGYRCVEYALVSLAAAKKRLPELPLYHSYFVVCKNGFRSLSSPGTKQRQAKYCSRGQHQIEQYCLDSKSSSKTLSKAGILSRESRLHFGHHLCTYRGKEQIFCRVWFQHKQAMFGFRPQYLQIMAGWLAWPTFGWYTRESFHQSSCSLPLSEQHCLHIGEI